MNVNVQHSESAERLIVAKDQMTEEHTGIRIARGREEWKEGKCTHVGHKRRVECDSSNKTLGL